MADIEFQQKNLLRDHVFRKVHLDALLLAAKGYFVPASTPGLQVTQKGAGPNMSVDVAAGTYYLAGVTGTYAGGNVAIDASDGSNDRIDVLYISAGGAMTISKGAAAAIAPVGETAWQKFEAPYPLDTSTLIGIILAEIRVRAATTQILTADIRMVAVGDIAADFGKHYIASQARGDLLAMGASAWSRLAGVERGSILYEGANLDPAWLIHGNYADRLLSGGHGADPFIAGGDGWIPAGETWTYASADDPTYTFTVTGNQTSKYWPGQRIKWTQTSVRYGIVTKVSYSSPNTTITMYGGTDYNIDNATITLPFYSMVKAPVGFPLDPNLWSVSLSDTSSRSQLSPTAGTWYNLGSLSLSIPIGLWYVSYSTYAAVNHTSSNTLDMYITLSTANNSESSPETTTAIGIGSDTQYMATPSKSFSFNLATKASYYLNAKTGRSVYGIYFQGDQFPTIIKAVCGYL